ncbi:hypothetical protein GCM10028895_48400 [Pontibacter rugosus]
MKLAAIDIGSNAVRCQISSVLNQNGNVFFKKVEYVRYPIRFGEDVFNTGYISDVKVNKFVKLLKAFQLLLDVHDVDHYMICATSAMRSALNAPEIIEHVKQETGLEIQVIDGETEAFLINKVIFSFLDERNYLHIDVGVAVPNSTSMLIVRRWLLNLLSKVLYATCMAVTPVSYGIK